MLIFMGCLYSTVSKVSLLERFSFSKQKLYSHLEAKQEFLLEFYSCSLDQPPEKTAFSWLSCQATMAQKYRALRGVKKNKEKKIEKVLKASTGTGC